jgi:hypothetical protein
VLLYDDRSPAATRLARRLEQGLPVGYPVLSWRDLPPEGTLRIDEHALGGTIAWVEADGTTHLGRDGAAQALIASGGRAGIVGHAMRIPVVGRIVGGAWRRIDLGGQRSG